VIGGPFDMGQGGLGGWLIIDEPELHLGEDVLVPDLAGWRRSRMPQLPDTASTDVVPTWSADARVRAEPFDEVELELRTLRERWPALPTRPQGCASRAIQRMLARLKRLIAIAVLFGASVASAADAPPVDFARDIQPIFVKRCHKCHGPDTQESNLRLDHKADALKGGDSERSMQSQLIERITSDDPEEVMPQKGRRVNPQQLALLKAWINQGAPWPDQEKHWAFTPAVRDDLPDVKNTRWPKNPIDHFILARLEREGLAPSAEAERPTLLRRVSLDLIGLPPTPAEVDAFVRDKSAQAYEGAVDRLLASPHYGEQMARGWLDLARYADSNGYQADVTRSIWPYRDWVITAFNQNMPFDQFTIEQLAGDLLPNATLAQRIATGFNRNSKVNDEGGGDDEEFRTKAVKDRVATTATTWLGLTMACAECHTHKYDPISIEEYYRFYAFFNQTADRGNSKESSVSLPVPPPPTQQRFEALHRRLAGVRQQLVVAEGTLAAEQEGWERRMFGKARVWTPLALDKAVSTGGALVALMPDRSALATGASPAYDSYQLEARTDLPTTAVLLEVLPDATLPHLGPGRFADTGNFILDELSLTAGDGAPVAFARATADWEQTGYRAEDAIDRNPRTGWAISPMFGQRHFLIAELASPVAAGKLGFRLDSSHGNSHAIGRLRVSVTSERDRGLLWPVPPLVATALAAAPRTPAQTTLLAAFYRTVSPEIRRIERELFRLNEQEVALANVKYTTLVMSELEEPRPTFVQVRGNFLEKGQAVTANVPAALPPLPAGVTADRLALARWLVDAQNPLTARVTVNRLWQRVFGTGLVRTSEDFGTQGERPSHPALLDWLASELADGWNVKRVVRLIVTSAAYRQSANISPALLQKDPDNRLLARGPRFRMDPEMLRDQALAVSGLLNPELGGPSVYPVQLAHLWKELGFLRPETGMDEWPTSEGPDLYRRGLYTFWRRVCTYPTFATFDAPSRDVCTSRRQRSNTPLQALAALNDPMFLEAARVLGQRVLLEGGADPGKQVDYAFRLCVARTPTPQERARLLRLYDEQLKGFEGDAKAAQALVRQGTADRPAGVDVRKLAAWMVVGNVLLNLDETLTK
jgi:mono/diheme cytochrome c family protein